MKQEIFSNNLRKLRLEKNYTQEQVADALSVSPQSVSRWECGTTLPDVLLLPELARTFEVTIDDLFKEDITAYRNYAQRLLAVYEASGSSEDFIRAEKEFQKLLQSESCTADDLRAFGVLYHYMLKNCRKQAEFYFDKVIAEYKEQDAECYFRTCRQKMAMWAELGKEKENIRIQEDAVEKDSNNAEQWSLLLAAYFFAKEYEKAYECATKAINKFPKEALLYVYAGDSCRELKRYEEALNFWKKSLELDNTWLDASYSIGFCYEELGEYEKAYTTWTELAEILRNRGLVVEKEFPMQLAEKCREKLNNAAHV